MDTLTAIKFDVLSLRHTYNSAAIERVSETGWVEVSPGMEIKHISAMGTTCIRVKQGRKKRIVARIGQGSYHFMAYFTIKGLTATPELRDLFNGILRDIGARKQSIEVWLHNGELIVTDKFGTYNLDREIEGKSYGTVLSQQLPGLPWTLVSLDKPERIPGKYTKGADNRDLSFSDRANYLLNYMWVTGWQSKDDHYSGMLK